MGIRKGLERVFSLHDLSWLDSLLPDAGAGGTQPRQPQQEESSSEEVGDAQGARPHHGRLSAGWLGLA